MPTLSVDTWRNRIVGEGVRPASQFTANPRNWRVHGEAQQGAMAAVLREVGWVQRVIVNRTTGNVVDGHLRVEEALKRGKNEPVPYVEVELTPEEEDLILASYDPIAALAGRDSAGWNELIEGISTDDDALAALFAPAPLLAPAFEPQLEPSAFDPMVTEADLARAKAKLREQLHREIEQRPLHCPHCGEEFFLDAAALESLSGSSS